MVRIVLDVERLRVGTTAEVLLIFDVLCVCLFVCLFVRASSLFGNGSLMMGTFWQLLILVEKLISPKTQS